MLHVITGLNDGGAEGVLYRLTRASNGYQHIVVSLTGDGKYGKKLKDEGFTVVSLRKGNPIVILFNIIKLFNVVRSSKPDVVQTWMYHSDLVGGIVARICLVPRVCWGVRRTYESRHFEKWTTRFLAKVCSYVSYRIPNEIIYCGDESMRSHVRLGYDSSKNVVIYNGFDMSTLYPSINERVNFRASVGIKDSDFVIGMVGRYTKEKDHGTLLLALLRLKELKVNFKCVLIGKDITNNNVDLFSKVLAYELQNDVFLLGQSDNVLSVYNGLDLHVLSSAIEGFPNVVAEAMSCGTPVISTDVGDAAEIIGDDRFICPPQNPDKLALSIYRLYMEEFMDIEAWKSLKHDVRSRVKEKFSLQQMVKLYAEVWDSK